MSQLVAVRRAERQSNSFTYVSCLKPYTSAVGSTVDIPDCESIIGAIIHGWESNA